MTLEQFIENLYAAGWDSPCDAQHENIAKIWEDLEVATYENRIENLKKQRVSIRAKLEQGRKRTAELERELDLGMETMAKAETAIYRLMGERDDAREKAEGLHAWLTDLLELFNQEALPDKLPWK